MQRLNWGLSTLTEFRIKDKKQKIQKSDSIAFLFI